MHQASGGVGRMGHQEYPLRITTMACRVGTRPGHGQRDIFSAGGIGKFGSAPVFEVGARHTVAREKIQDICVKLVAALAFAIDKRATMQKDQQRRGAAPAVSVSLPGWNRSRD